MGTALTFMPSNVELKEHENPDVNKDGEILVILYDEYRKRNLLEAERDNINIQVNVPSVAPLVVSLAQEFGAQRAVDAVINEAQEILTDPEDELADAAEYRHGDDEGEENADALGV